MFCVNCGKKNVDGASFCSYCGAEMAVMQQSVPVMENTVQTNSNAVNNTVNVAPVANNTYAGNTYANNTYANNTYADNTYAGNNFASSHSANFPEWKKRWIMTGILFGASVAWSIITYYLIGVPVISFSYLFALFSCSEIFDINKKYKNGDMQKYEKLLKGNKTTLIIGFVIFGFVFVWSFDVVRHWILTTIVS